MRVRIAKSADAKILTKLYFDGIAEDRENFMSRLGFLFMWTYHRILLSEPNSVVLLLENDDGVACGCISGTLSADEHRQAVKSHKISLGLSGAVQFILKPNLIIEVVRRLRSLSNDNQKENQYLALTGARLEFWSVNPAGREGGGALFLLNKWIEIARCLGAGDISLEINKSHEATIGTMHRIAGAKKVRSYSTPDGRGRVEMIYPKID